MHIIIGIIVGVEYEKIADNPDAAVAFKAAFDNFRKEAVKRKRLVRQIDTEEKAFADWLFKQQGEADRLMGEFEV